MFALSRLFGFLLGTTLAGASVYYYILEEYKVSNELLTEDIYVRTVSPWHGLLCVAEETDCSSYCRQSLALSHPPNLLDRPFKQPSKDSTRTFRSWRTE